MSYTDFLKRMAVNRPVVLDTQMRYPDASAYTWRLKLATTSINQRSAHVINNVLTSAPALHSKQVMSYSGSGYGGKVQDASSYTLSLGSAAIGQDNFSNGRLQTTGQNAVGDCLTRTPASQVVSERGNAENVTLGLNMGYITCNTPAFHPQTKSYFVDTIPDLKTHKIGSAPQVAATQTAGGRQVVQNPVVCRTTTSGVLINQEKAIVPYNSHSARPYNPAKALFITGIQGPQVGGGNTSGSRAPKTGGPTLLQKHAITHRGWASPTRSPYPHPRVPPTGAPAHLKINDPNHYKF